MDYVIKGRKPESMFRFFEELSAIPRSSGNETAASDYLEAFAAENGLDCYRDEVGNLFIKREASPGKEDRPAVLLQSHIDMVCEKNAGTDHDFSKDPLKLRVNGDILTATGTTLGGDDGIGVAAMMSALVEDIPHPALECLFTVDEEVGMKGARNFDYSKVSAKYLLNLDSEGEGIGTVSCAGGIRMECSLPTDRLAVPNFGKTLTIKIRGLAGGHSGADIHLCRKNAIYLAGRLMAHLYAIAPFNLVSVNGGGKDNAIARECDITLFTPDAAAVADAAMDFAKTVSGELCRDDANFKILTDRPKNAKEGETMLTFKDTSKVIDLLTLLPHGVLSTCPAEPGVVESSSNYGIVKNFEDGILVTMLARSSVNSVLDEIIDKTGRVCRLIGAEMNCYSRYPGWKLVKDTNLQRIYTEVASKVLGRDDIEIKSIHAGLECGVMTEALPGIDAISIGPELSDIHTPEESLDLASSERFWDIVRGVLEAI